jgi:hypothetical protein
MTSLHANLVFYNKSPKPGHAYRQLVIIEAGGAFEFRRYEGDGIRAEQELQSSSTDAEIRVYSSYETAMADFQEETTRAHWHGWIPLYGLRK